MSDVFLSARDDAMGTCEGAPKAVLLRNVGGVLEEERLGQRLAVDRNVPGDFYSFCIGGCLLGQTTSGQGVLQPVDVREQSGTGDET